jgi:threonine dehydrogenase-like Zn-dependent dehydrogenase
MRAIVKLDPTAPGIAVDERDEPDLGADDDVLVRVGISSISGSEVNIWRGSYRLPSGQPIAPGRVLGYEHAGVIVTAGVRAQDEGFVSGGRVALASPFIGCGRCAPCRAGLVNRCRAWGHVGITRDGTDAEVASLPMEVLSLLPDGVDPLDGAFLNTAALAVRAVTRVSLGPGESVAVVGPGPVGLYLVQAAIAAGAGWVAVIGRGSDRARLDIAERLGAHRTMTDDEAREVIARESPGGVDVVLEAAGTPDGVELATDLAAVGGRVALTGLPPERYARFQAIRVTRDEVSIVGVEGNTAPDRDRAMSLIRDGRLSARALVTHRFDLEQADEAFALVGRGEACKAVFEMVSEAG